MVMLFVTPKSDVTTVNPLSVLIPFLSEITSGGTKTNTSNAPNTIETIGTTLLEAADFAAFGIGFVIALEMGL